MGRSQTSYQPTESAERTPADRPKPNVLIYLVDTLRADHLGAYGYGRPTSPHLDQFAEGSVLFERARAQSPWTRASVASVFTGLWPQVHGANGDSDLLGEGALTLAEVLREVGYETAGITTNGNTTRTTGFAQGFEHFEFLKAEDHLIRSPELNRAALEWLDRRSADRPFFLYLHTIDPHAPYAPQEPFRAEFASEADPSIATIRQLVDLQKSAFAPPVGRKEELVALYDGEIAANDAAFGALLAALRERGLFDDTLIIFLSDHGEEFYEHGSWQHGKSLYAEILDVPLVIKLPSMKSGRRVGAIVQHVDLMPTILDYLGAMEDYEGQGRSMLALIEGRETAESWEDYAVAHMHLRGARASTLLTREWKLIQPWANDADVRGFPELYRLSDDPGEARNLAPELTNQAFLISARLSRLENAAGAGVESRSLEEGDLADEEDQLRALGYIED